jgi:hypothetical protein
MDIIFDCPNCEQELAVDSAGAGSEIECPSCHETITIPAKSTKVASAETPAPAASEAPAPSLAPSAINASAAAKVQMHLKVPVSNKPGASLIKKAAVPLTVTAKGGDKQIRVRTIRRDKCIESGHDKFDETVTAFLAEVGEANIVGLHTISFSHVDVGSQKLLTDYGLLVIYRG